MDARQLLDFQLMLYVQAPWKIKELYPEMTIKGPAQVGDRGATTVLAKSGNGISTELAFDNETGLLLRAGTLYFEDYRDAGKIKRPFMILLGQDEGEAHLLPLFNTCNRSGRLVVLPQEHEKYIFLNRFDAIVSGALQVKE